MNECAVSRCPTDPTGKSPKSLFAASRTGRLSFSEKSVPATSLRRGSTTRKLLQAAQKHRVPIPEFVLEHGGVFIGSHGEELHFFQLESDAIDKNNFWIDGRIKDNWDKWESVIFGEVYSVVNKLSFHQMLLFCDRGHTNFLKVHIQRVGAAGAKVMLVQEDRGLRKYGLRYRQVTISPEKYTLTSIHDIIAVTNELINRFIFQHVPLVPIAAITARDRRACWSGCFAWLDWAGVESRIEDHFRTNCYGFNERIKKFGGMPYSGRPYWWYFWLNACGCVQGPSKSAQVYPAEMGLTPKRVPVIPE